MWASTMTIALRGSNTFAWVRVTAIKVIFIDRLFGKQVNSKWNTFTPFFKWILKIYILLTQITFSLS